MIEAGLEAAVQVFHPTRLGFIMLGSCIGLAVGVLPGLGGAVGMSVVLPFVFGMDPFSGMALLMGMVAVIHTADTFASVLLGVPGSAGSQATIMDGYPLAREGQAARALGAAFTSSLIGGLVGAVGLFAIVGVARPFVLSMGSPQLFMLTLLGLSMVGILSQGKILGGLVAGVIGMVVGSIGGAPAVSEYRWTFDTVYLFDGIPLPVLALGLFALPEMLDLLSSRSSIAKAGELVGSRLSGMREALSHKWLIVRSSLLGGTIGMIPGLGGPVVDWIAYGAAMQSSKDNSNFGKGDIRGVIAPESANNSKEAGALVPTLLFSVPGSSTTAILLGGLILMGVQAGPAMVGDDLPVLLTIVWTLAIANVVGVVLCLLFAGGISRVSTIPADKLVPFLMVLMIVASYQSTRHWGDILTFVGIGVAGWVMKHMSWPRAPLIIGFVLSVPAERYLHLSMSRYDNEWMTWPSVLAIGVLTLVSIGVALYWRRREQAKQAYAERRRGDVA